MEENPIMSSELSFLNATKHNELRFQRANDFSFARKLHFCPLLAREIYGASMSFPILFPVEGAIIPQAVLSLEPNTNNLVAEDGSWKGGYLPQHFRRYPFYLGREKDSNQGAILFDESAPHFGGDDGQPLFTQDGEEFTATPLLEDIKTTLKNFDVAYQETVAMCKLLVNTEVLEPAQIMHVSGETKKAIGGFKVVNWDKVAKLSDEVLANWSRIGLIQMINSHLWSIKRLNRKGADRPAEE